MPDPDLSAADSARPRGQAGRRVTFEAIGTRWEIDTEDALDPAVLAAARARIAAYDAVFSRFRPDSVVAAMARAPGSFALPPAETGALLALYGTLATLTDGAVSPLVGGSLEHLGYDAVYSLTPGVGRVQAPAFDDVCRWDGERLTTSRPVMLDVGAVGKGQLADLVLGVLADAGVGGAITVDAGGDLVHRPDPAASGTPAPLRVGLEDPDAATAGPRRVVGTVELGAGDHRAVCGSAPNRRAWRGVHHVLDARTGAPVDGVAATWAVARSAAVADAASTALFFAAPAEVERVLGASGVRLGSDRRAWTSPGFPGTLFTVPLPHPSPRPAPSDLPRPRETP